MIDAVATPDTNKRSVILKKASDINMLNLNVKIPEKYNNFGNSSDSESASPTSALSPLLL